MLFLGSLALVFVTFFGEVAHTLPFPTTLKIIGGLLLLGYWITYCRVRVTPWEVRVLSSGIWKRSYRCPLEAAAVGGCWVLPELAAREEYHWAALSFCAEEDYDSGTPYVEIEFYGDTVFNCFRPKQLGQIEGAIAHMRARRLVLEAAASSK